MFHATQQEGIARRITDKTSTFNNYRYLHDDTNKDVKDKFATAAHVDDALLFQKMIDNDVNIERQS